ncbi:MAG: DUF4132 domain-containing protein [Lachnospiraceae bacterium]|nr:DUF4132 domain-containing protein [Lachnospiraceae bacterium]
MDEQERRKIITEVERELKDADEALIGSLDPDIRDYIRYCEDFKNYYRAYPDLDMKNNRFRNGLISHLKENNSPSEYFKKHIDKFKTYISQELLPYFYKSIDSIPTWQSDYNSYARRSYRSRNNLLRGMERMGDILLDYRKLSSYKLDAYSMITYEGADERMRAYLDREYRGFDGMYYIAAKLDEGDAKLEDILEGIFYRDEGRMRTEYIRAIMMSHNEKMFEMAGKTLIAARLSEGLRQSICENMDYGTEEAFRYMLNIITENDLLRFSSVKRAFYVFTGLGYADVKDMDRISNKHLELIRQALADEGRIEEMLKTEDSMQIYLGLWATGFADIDKALDRAEKLCLEGSRHQRLTACYFMAYTNVPYADKNALVNRMLKEYRDDKEVLALLMHIFMRTYRERVRAAISDGMVSRYNKNETYKKRGFVQWDEFFASEEECREYHELLMELLEEVPKKGCEFNPCVFPWNEENLSRSAVVSRIVYCASALKDKKLMAGAAAMLKEISVAGYGSDRENSMELLLREPDTPELLDALTDEIADAETYTRNAANELLKQELEADRSGFDAEIAAPAGRLPERCYDRLEGMLRLKKEDLRNNVISFLKTREAEDMLKMLKRLLSDSKEEKVTAALDIMLGLRDSNDPLFKQAVEMLTLVKDPTSREKVLINEISGSAAEEKTEAEDFYDVNAEYEPVIDETYLAECAEAYMQVFPDSKVTEVLPQTKKGVKGLRAGVKKALMGNVTEKKDVEVLKKLDDLIEANKDREYTNYNGPVLLKNGLGNEWIDGKVGNLAFSDLWDDFYEKNMTPEQAVRIDLMYTSYYAYHSTVTGLAEHFRPFISNVLGGADPKYSGLKLRYPEHVRRILSHCCQNAGKALDGTRQKTAAFFAYYICNCKDSLVYEYKSDKETQQWTRRNMDKDKTYAFPFTNLPFVSRLLTGLSSDVRNFPIMYEFSEKVYRKMTALQTTEASYYARDKKLLYTPLLGDYICAVDAGYISRDFMYKKILGEDLLEDTLDKISSLICCVREADRSIATRQRYSNNAYKQRAALENLFKKKYDEIDLNGLSESDGRKLELAGECYENITPLVMDRELVRGDTETEYSRALRSMKRIYGLKYFVRILLALGNDTLDRSVYYYYYSYGNRGVSKKESLSHLLSVCIPDPKDGDEKEQAKQLKKLIKGTDIKEARLIEAGLYSPEWLPVINEYLGWKGFISGCYYFMAHMNEKFDNKRAAMIAKYTPLTEDELNTGAFDIDWFKEVYGLLGDKRFNEIYKAAKYISDGAKHTRARKYSDAACGKMDAKETEKQIEDKRNKDLLMAYALIPAKSNEIKKRYAFIQKFLKGSKQFGAQRRASEKAAAEMAVKNLAKASGYEDDTRFSLKMEREIASELLGFFKAHEVGEYSLYLEADGEGKVSLVAEKAGKILKSLPAAIKKDEYVLDIQEAKKTFTEQYRRTKQMLEEAMENETQYLAEEILDMSSDPVSGPIVNRLLYIQAEGDFIGFVSDIKDAGFKADERLLVAHPYQLFKAGRWHEFQKICFEKEIRQPFKQIFRELYIKTDDEMQQIRSERYAGNQINPKITVGALRNRRWIADAEEGLQKVYYKENLIATIYALADWFSPSDIEAPTLEWVAFYDRKSFKEKPISEIPDIIFSEVMRDVDMAVSVAHAGEIDPEMSHSTIEMRKAIAEFVIPMFKLKNVTFTDSHALIKGERGSYSVHLGSGVIHQEGGPMINVLPVHSQHRGRIFLPFVDDDPKTAEVLSKIIFFAEDQKIKDPYILDQLV